MRPASGSWSCGEQERTDHGRACTPFSSRRCGARCRRDHVYPDHAARRRASHFPAPLHDLLEIPPGARRDNRYAGPQTRCTDRPGLRCETARRRRRSVEGLDRFPIHVAPERGAANQHVVPVGGRGCGIRPPQPATNINAGAIRIHTGRLERVASLQRTDSGGRSVSRRGRRERSAQSADEPGNEHARHHRLDGHRGQ